jgi:UDPglucose 6-dehydrogenase
VEFGSLPVSYRPDTASLQPLSHALMNIAVIGTGYVGLVTAACFAETGNHVVGADIDERKINGLKNGVIPIFEPGLEEMIRRNQKPGRLRFTTDVGAAVAESAIVFIAVGTPPDADGSADLAQVLAVAETIGKHLARETVVVNKSTVPVGTATKTEAVLRKFAKFPFHVVSNPEFLKEGAALDDFMKPDRIVVGAESDFAKSVMADLYAPFTRSGNRTIFMDIRSAEMTKYAANAMLAARISFMNEIANLCERLGANVDQVRVGIGSDSRIGSAFLFPGPGYGGSCFPKDVKALARTARDQGLPMQIIEAVESVNERQKHRVADKVSAALGGQLSGCRIALWGLSFKPRTDDMRDAPSLTIIDDLLAAGASVRAHDPIAIEEAKRRLGDRISYEEDQYAALDGADVLVVVTDWHEYRHPEFEQIRARLKRPIVVDARNLYALDRMERLGIAYHSIGRPSTKG